MSARPWGGDGGGPGAGRGGPHLVRPLTLCLLPVVGMGIWPAVLPSPPVGLSQSSVACAEPRALVAMESQQWESRGPFQLGTARA